MYIPNSSKSVTRWYYDRGVTVTVTVTTPFSLYTSNTVPGSYIVWSYGPLASANLPSVIFKTEQKMLQVKG